MHLQHQRANHMTRDQLYFERVHPICPMIHQWRYMAWNRHKGVSPARVCLRLAMRTMAAAMSAQYRGFSETLYMETYRLLEQSCQRSSETPFPPMNELLPIEKIQAWLLLTHYQALRRDEGQASLTAGRAFRLVQIARLHDLDAPDKNLSTSCVAKFDRDHAELEERRRTFWVAFTLDRFLCWRNEGPLTLHEEAVSGLWSLLLPRR